MHGPLYVSLPSIRWKVTKFVIPYKCDIILLDTEIRGEKKHPNTDHNLFINLRLPMNLDSTWRLDVGDSPEDDHFLIRNRCKRTPGRGD